MERVFSLDFHSNGVFQFSTYLSCAEFILKYYSLKCCIATLRVCMCVCVCAWKILRAKIECSRACNKSQVDDANSFVGKNSAVLVNFFFFSGQMTFECL